MHFHRKKLRPAGRKTAEVIRAWGEGCAWGHDGLRYVYERDASREAEHWEKYMGNQIFQW